MQTLKTIANRPQLSFASLAVVVLALLPAIAFADMHWQKSWRFKVNGQRFTVQPFISSLKPDAVMRRLVRENGVYSRYHIADRRILLSGLAQRSHWVAEIYARPEGAQGHVSRLHLSPDPQSSFRFSGRVSGDRPSGPASREFMFDEAASVIVNAGSGTEVQVLLQER